MDHPPTVIPAIQEVTLTIIPTILTEIIVTLTVIRILTPPEIQAVIIQIGQVAMALSDPAALAEAIEAPEVAVAVVAVADNDNLN